MLKIVIIVLVLFWIARVIGRWFPRVEITFDRGADDDVRIYSIMREHFPEDYERYKLGLLSEGEERRLYLDCVEILGARREIERLQVSSALGQGIRLFDVEEAERMLPLIRVIVKGMMDDHAERQALLDRLDGPADGFTPRELRALRSEIDTLTEKLSEAGSELENLGVEFKGIDLGLVDFPTTIQGELAYLCWGYGEDRIEFWHSPDGGYAGRRPLERD